MNMHWSDGVHQFLELKHNLRMTPERMCDSFFSNVTLFKRYRPYLFGVTGTLGGNDAQNFIRTVYQIDTVIVPKYVDSQFDIYPSEFGIFRGMIDGYFFSQVNLDEIVQNGQQRSVVNVNR